MRTKISLLLSVNFLVLLFAAGVNSQPMPANLKGQAVATCFSGLQAPSYTTIKNDYVVGVIDAHVPIGPGTVSNWPAPMYHGASNSWKSSNFGQVYGIAIDKRNNIYITATTCYGNFPADPLAFGPAGSGGIYRLDGVSGNGSVFISTANFTQTPAASVGTSTIPNGNGTTIKPGLGNICYDPVHDKLFVTNHEDGVIYRIDPLTGLIDAYYDPIVPAAPLATTNPAMTADNQTLGFAPLGERLWGIGYNARENRIYYSVWMEDLGNGTVSTGNIIRSIGLTSTGAFNPPSDDKAEILLPGYASNNVSGPVADIEFSSAGKMLVGECSMTGPTNRSAHASRVFQYSGLSLSWSPAQQIYVGASSGTNSTGGVDYGYRKFDTLKFENLDCDSVLWMSGDFLAFPPGFAGVYGLQRSPASGNTPGTVASTGYFIDLNGVPGTQDKYQIGDVDIFRDSCGIVIAQAPCAKNRVIYTSMQTGVPGGPCCYKIQLSNGTANFWTNVTAQSITPGFVFGSATVPPGWSLTNSGTLANWMPPGAFIPAGLTDSLILCITSMVNPPQKVEIVWHGVDGSVCRDTITLDCPAEKPPIPPCAIVKQTTLACTQATAGAYTYQYCFTVTNNSPFSQSPYFYPAENLMIWSSTPGVNVSPGAFNFAPIGFGGTTGQLCVTLSGANVHPGSTICIVIQLHGKKNAQGDGFQWCCPPDTVCFTLPPCKDCCDGFRKVLDKLNFTTNGNGVTTLSASVTAGPMPITKFTATIVSADVKRFGNSHFCASTGWLAATGELINPPLSIAGLPFLGTPQPFATTPPAPYREGLWGVVPSGVTMAGSPLSLQFQFPAPPPPFNGCFDSLRFCVRLSFTDTSCRTCDTLICMQIKRVGSWIIHVGGELDPHIGKITMTSKTQGTLTLSLPKLPPELTAEDGIRISGIALESEPGVHVLSLDGVPASDYIGRKNVSLTNGDQLSMPVTFDNYSDVRTFLSTLTYRYSPNNNAATILSESEQILATVPGGSAGDEFGKDDVTPRPSSVRTYALYFANRNKAGIVTHSATLRIGKGGRILATGPFEDSLSVSYSAMNGAVDGKPHLFAKASPWFVDGPECKIAYGSVIRPIYLTVSGGDGKTVTVYYQTRDEGENIISEDSVTLNDPLAVVGTRDPAGSRTSGYLYPPYPNPTSSSASVQFHLESDDYVSLFIVNSLGHEVGRILLNERFGSGDHIFLYSFDDMPSGMYTVILQTASGSQSQKLQVVH